MRPTSLLSPSEDGVVGSLLALSGAKPLAVVMLLPITSGIFPSIVLSGGLTSVTAAVELGVLVFSGGASVAVVLAQFDGPRRRELRLVAAIGAILIPGAAVTAAVAPVVRALLRVELFSALTALAVAVIGLSVGCEDDPGWLPSPVALGVGLSTFALVDALSTALAGPVTLAFVVDGGAVRLSVLAAGVGVAVVASVVTVRPFLLYRLDVGQFRIGCAVALWLVAADIAGVVDGPSATIAIVCAAALSYGPPGANDGCPADERATAVDRRER